ncbi:MAG: magnesium transporter [Pirellula sp.]|nr:magnesium transporter [Pirellula sp.]
MNAERNDSRVFSDHMDGEDLNRPWEDLRQSIAETDPMALKLSVETLLESGEIGRAISRLDSDEQRTLLRLLPADTCATLIESVAETQAVELLKLLSTDDAAAIFNELVSDEQADLLAELSDKNAEAILDAMDPEEAAQARQLTSYDPESSGGLMITELLQYREGQTVRDVLEDLRANANDYTDYDVQYAYVVKAESDELVGVLRLRDLLLSRDPTPITDVMIRDPHFVLLDTSLEKLAEFFNRHHFFGVPVVDDNGCLKGVVRKIDVEEALTGRADVFSMEIQGIIGGEELRSMPLRTRAIRRLIWLVANIFLNLIAVSVIAVYQETISAVIALAVFLPLISNMGGNAGIQAIAVSIREMSLGLLKPNELLWVATKEVTIGAINGLILGSLIGIAGWLWKQNAWLGVVVGVSMTIDTVIAVVAGGLMPLILKRFKLDPALAAGPILTTLTDMTGFLLVLSFANSVLKYLVP